MMQGYIAVPKYFDAKQKMAMAIPVKRWISGRRGVSTDNQST